MLYRHSARSDTHLGDLNTAQQVIILEKYGLCLDPVNHNHICQNEILAITLLQGYYLR